MAKQNISYEDILTELESIVNAVEKGELEIDQLAQQLKRAQTLLSLGKSQLQKVKNDVQKILDHEQK
ncbi:exodeoxyribonuclease VII small subunit [Alloprevotella sp. OH1205_COT-284]|uniref:exodeoxyribonuclease VII small subunit n=1 Tax=Alloprevotella sp. OH1205_COT-284 TaxID=2491043 RepID=UPI000F5D8959|nr:exodeoxyribonuclease VII small subunit [Alloprevotella sp. OH1205_COT-284]RRD78496.1 exodeoxyribonuclease VII small subunit [Alloprevotella sp. OH1205_COT-284]